MPVSPHWGHVHPFGVATPSPGLAAGVVTGLSGRISKHATHCRVRASFSNVQRGQTHGSLSIGRGDAREVVGVAVPEGGGVTTFVGRTREYERRLPGSEPLIGVLTGGVVLAVALGIRVATLVITPDESGSSRMTTSESASFVRSITSLCVLSMAAFSVSRSASAPDAHDSSSRVRRSAA